VLITKGRTDGLLDKMDVYLANDRLTTEEYNELSLCCPIITARYATNE
jgi:hypothetical protein